MALTNSGSCCSWSPQLLDMMSNGSSREPTFSAFSLEGAAAAGCGGSWPCYSSSTTLLNFAGVEDDDCAAWIGAVDRNRHISRRFEMKTTTAETRPLEGQRCAPVMNAKGQEKRPIPDCNFPSPKKRCGTTRTAEDKQSPSKHPQSIAAKNRRERISERLRILQDLVPNGAKVDLVTMLEKAINYVKFLQLQVKVLATDEFWPTPDVARAKEAIDAILSSSREESSKDRNNW